MPHSFKELVEGIVSKHHSLLRRELPKITEMLSQLSAQCRGSEPLSEAEQIFKKVRTKIETHLNDEETSLFPTGIALEAGKAAPPCEMDLLARLEEMEKEHENCGNALTKILQMVSTVPASQLREHVIDTIAYVQDDLNIHVEKENTQVHPRFLELVGASVSSQ
ncbi:MAG: hemerythrin domain-containing protein [Candidatus Melainabacteria bacterium]|nr:hemerythrin domain-containing protein [Candidatus Melainabacteria bacterium]